MTREAALILQCPITRTSLFWVDEHELELLNKRLAQRTLFHLDGTPVSTSLKAALISQDRALIYPILDDICILLPCLAILADENCRPQAIPSCLDSEKDAVRAFYEEIGWQHDDHGIFEDAAKFEDLRPVSRDYIQRCHLRVKRALPCPGKYLLDIASGPIQYPAYLSYSEGYQYRICADISLTALKAAKGQLGEQGLYLLCDITNLPMKENSVDAVISLHTIYHVPADEQRQAFQEVCRVVKAGGRCVVVYTWGEHSALMNIAFPQIPACSELIRRLKHRITPHIPFRKTLRRTFPRPAQSPDSQLTSCPRPPSGPTLYFYPHDYAWFKATILRHYNFKITCWRSVSVPFLRTYIHPQLLGKQLLSALYALEEMFPAFFGRYGQYPLLVYHKKKLNISACALPRQ